MKPAFINLRPKSFKYKQKASTTNFSSRVSETPSFINEVVRQWPSWQILKQNVGVMDLPATMVGDERFHFQKVENVPLPVNRFMRSITIIGYFVYTDTDNGLIYFYPTYSTYGAAYIKRDSHPGKQEFGDFSEVEVKVLNLKSGLKELQELMKKQNYRL